MANERLKRDPSTSPNAFRQFLNWLDDGSDSRGEKYLEMRRRLVAYFDRKNCVAPDDLADETLNRVARRLEEEGIITGTGFPKVFYLAYTMYRQYFPLLALTTYKRAMENAA